jgi:putative phosphoribosyl transferase
MLEMFQNRHEAGLLLADTLRRHPVVSSAASERLLALSIPRGGVVVGAAVAKALDCEHDVIVVKKIGFPGQPEFAAGAVAEDGPPYLNSDVIAPYRSDSYFMHELNEQTTRTRLKIAQQISDFRQGRRLSLADRIAIVVDDGIATGETVKAAVRWLNAQPAANQPAGVIVAAPVCSPQAVFELRTLADVVFVLLPDNFHAVGQFYREFEQVGDDEVRRILVTPRQTA